MSVAVDIYAELNGAPFAANDNAVTANGTYRYDGKLKRVTGTEGLYEHADLLGSPRSLTDVSGSPDEKAFYSPFGMEYGNTNIKGDQAGFTGHIKDSATGLNYMQARYYDPVMGRFLSIDPMDFVGSGGNPGYFNRYSYTMNDPINATDPTGMVVCDNDSRCDSIHDAADSARGSLSNAQSSINDLQSAIEGGGQLTAAQAGVKAAVESKFGAGSATSSNLGKISSQLGAIHDKIGARGTGANIKFQSKANGTAHMSANRSTNTINVYPGFNPKSSLNTYYISHEAGHLAGLGDQPMPASAPQIYGRSVTARGFNGRFAYGNNAAWWLGQNAPATAAINNDNYHCFALKGRC